MKVLTAAEMAACDRVTTERYGVPQLKLMRAASTAVAEFARQHFRRVRRVTVLCGKGNNGGNGMMAARKLADAGLEVTTLLLGAPVELKGDAAEAWKELAGPAHGRIYAVTTAEELAKHRSAFETELIVDAVVGTGFKPPLRELALAALERVKASGAKVLAVDLPSGWAADSNKATEEGPVFPADAVVTFTAPKPAHVFGRLTRQWDDAIVVAQIGSPEAAALSEAGLRWTGGALGMVQARRAVEANKGNFGHVLVVGGALGLSGGKMGAPAMASLAALRAGAGLVTAAVPEPGVAMVGAIAPELMTWPLEATAAGEIAAKNGTAKRLEALLAGRTVLAIGPGMGQSAAAAKFLAELLRASEIPTVLDADALNLLAKDDGLLAELSRGGKRKVVLTPHPGEMARLMKTTTAAVQAERLKVAREFAEKTGVTVVLKGWRTVVAHADGTAAVNTTGNPGMAKGGSGDVLTGLVAGLLAQYAAEPELAVEAAVYLHGLAGDLAVRRTGEHGLLATDTLKELGRAFRFQPRDGSGYGWLQGMPRGDRRARAGREGRDREGRG
ncbi:MAG TPA: NAD(P)H-hydrate dehydratase [Terracidiphilus sp.]|nr:NAD(P)H-hydrate dehydratase [Terracidiphilus sp.]